MEEAIDDVLIWRIVLLCLLFLTAPDNSVILDSGLWKHVIRLLCDVAVILSISFSFCRRRQPALVILSKF